MWYVSVGYLKIIPLIMALSTIGTSGIDAQTLPLGQTPSGHYTIDVTIGASEPLTFVIDTGASHTAIAQPVAEQLGFVSQWVDLDDVQALTTRFEAERFMLNAFRVSHLPPTNLNSVVVPVAPETPTVIAGLLGADALPSQRYSLDFSRFELMIEAPAPEHGDGIYDRSRRLIFAKARLGSGTRRIDVLIDTGSARTLINSALDSNVHNRASGVSFSVGGVSSNLPVRTQETLLRRLQIGGLCVRRVSALENDLEIFETLGWEHSPAMVVGLDILQYAKIIVDRESGEVEISPTDPQHTCPTDERIQLPLHDMEGM